MTYGILLLRLVLGLTMAGHGAQKLFGWFGGHGPRGTAGFFGGLGFRAPLVMALMAGLAEFGGGLLLAAGLFTPFAALAVAVVMLNAIGTVHVRNGFWNSNGGIEFPLLVWASSVALAATGGLRFSLDAWLGWADNLGGLWWAVGVAVVGALVSLVTVGLGRRAPVPVSETVEEEVPAQRAA
jgi:putative oxidoreductase